MAPRPLLMVAATGDWTDETPEVEYPAVRRIFALYGAESRVHSVQFQAPHNFNPDSREAVYSWMARWFQHAPADVRVSERPYSPERLSNLLVFHGRALPDGALSADQLTDHWIRSAQEAAKGSDLRVLQTALLHSLALEQRQPSPAAAPSRVVLVAGDDRQLPTVLARRGFTVRPVRLTPYDADTAAAIEHFETYNRTLASQRVADIVQAIDANPGATLVADGDLGLAALLAVAVVPGVRAVIDAAQFENHNDRAFVDRLHIPGIRRAGDFRTAMTMSMGAVVIHNAADRFTLGGTAVQARKLSPNEIAALVGKPR